MPKLQLHSQYFNNYPLTLEMRAVSTGPDGESLWRANKALGPAAPPHSIFTSAEKTSGK